MNDDPKKTAGDKKYTEGYRTGRDGDILTRTFDRMFGFARPDSPYGKGFRQGVEDRYRYGSRSSEKSSSANKSKQSSTSNRANKSTSSQSDYRNYSNTGDSAGVFVLLYLWLAPVIVTTLAQPSVWDRKGDGIVLCIPVFNWIWFVIFSLLPKFPNLTGMLVFLTLVGAFVVPALIGFIVKKAK